MPTFSSRNFQSDIKSLENYHRFPSGKNDYGQSLTILSPKDFIEKYPDFFDENTDPDKLPKSASGIAAIVAASATGARKSIQRDKLASKGISALLRDDPELNNLFSPDKYVSYEEDEEGNKVPIYFQEPLKIEQFVKDIALLLSKYTEQTIQEKVESIKYDIQNDVDSRIEQIDIANSNILEDYVKEQLPKLIETNQNRTDIKKTFNHYGNQILSNNGYNNEVFKRLSSLNKEEVENLYLTWEQKIMQKKTNWENAGSRDNLSPQLVKAWTDASLIEILGSHNFYLTESLPAIDLTATIPEYNSVQNALPESQPQIPVAQPQPISAAVVPQQFAPQQQTQIISGTLESQETYTPPRSIGATPVSENTSLQDKIRAALQG